MAIKTLGIDHIHFNVFDLQRFRELMQKLFGAEMTPVGHLEPLGLFNSCVSFRDVARAPFMDVFQPANESSQIAEHLRRHGQGVSFVSFRVENIEAAAQHALDCGLHEISRTGYRGMKQVQFDTFDELGFMLELVEYEPGFEQDLAAVKERLNAGETVDGLRYMVIDDHPTR